MNQIETVTHTKRILWAARELKQVMSFDKETKERWRRAALDYHAYCQAHPGQDRCKIALLIGSTHFARSIAALQSKDRDGSLANIRQQLMAFARIVSLDAHPPNAIKGIGRCFKRDHSTVIYAVKKYGKAISEALECRS